MSKYRNFCFTQNNYPDTSLVDAIECKYIIYGREIGEENQTPHLQGFITFLQPKTLSAAIKSLPGCHVTVTRKVAESIEYCKKEKNYTERGSAPLEPKEKGLKEKLRWKRILAAAESGDNDWLREEEPQVYILHDQALERARKKARKTPQTLVGETKHEWFHGPPGTGKSRKAREDNPGYYLKDPKTKWWCGYAGEKCVIIDDFDKYQVSQGGEMKRWLDIYPFQAEAKNAGAVLIRPEKIVITSNYSPNEIWDDAITVQAIRRRVKTIYFPENTPFKYSCPIDPPGTHPSFTHPDDQYLL